jgi:DNA-binding IclR family transcriptional regulator
VIYIDKIDKGDSLISISNVGKRVPMHCCGVGKAMLAFLPEDYLEKYIFSAPLKKLTPNTITDRETLLRELKEVRTARIAYDREEIEKGLCCIASPVLQRDGLPRIAISLSFPYGRIRDIDERAARDEVLDCATRLSARLGYHG